MRTKKYQDLARLSLVEKTPLIALPSLGKELGDISLYVKRDDIGSIGGGGNKLRKLEYIVAEALAQGCDALITFGALQSNHARLTAAVAARLGLECHLILNRKVPLQGPYYEQSGNVLLNELFGAHVHILDTDANPLHYSEQLQSQLKEKNRQPYVIPFGGSNALGATGYISCVEELAEQSAQQNITIDFLVHASGSGGTQAGLLLGKYLLQQNFSIDGISVLQTSAVLEDTVRTLLAKMHEELGIDAGEGAHTINIDDSYVGEGYGLINKEVKETLRLAAQKEALLLDPVYTGKAFSGLLARARQGLYPPGSTVVFLHTGGLPGLFAYTDQIVGNLPNIPAL